MSYSRWGGSVWYTFWAGRNDETYDNALFEICQVASFEAHELRDDIRGCAKKARRITSQRAPVNDEDLEELIEYMQEFLTDIEQRYPQEASE